MYSGIVGLCVRVCLLPLDTVHQLCKVTVPLANPPAVNGISSWSLSCCVAVIKSPPVPEMGFAGLNELCVYKT